MRRRFQQRLVFVLAVDVDEHFTERFQLGERRALAVDVGTRATVARQHAAQDAQVVLLGEVVFAQPAQRFGVVAERESGVDVGTFGARADRLRIGAVAKRQAERVEHDRLARAGFAGDRGHACVQVDVELFDEGEILDGQLDQHAGKVIRQ
jgi:hypothetical protein